MVDENDDLFNAAMGKVTLLDDSDKIHIEKAKPRAALHQTGSCLRYTQVSKPQTSRFQVGEDPWELVADGVSRDHLKRLAAGSPSINHTYDLHGITRDAALTILQDALQQAMVEGDRVLCVVHGRGLHSQGKPILKQAVYHWLREGPMAHFILAAIPQPNSGGGACLILIRRQKKLL